MLVFDTLDSDWTSSNSLHYLRSVQVAVSDGAAIAWIQKCGIRRVQIDISSDH